jgi:outer membrane cobalamin receptor
MRMSISKILAAVGLVLVAAGFGCAGPGERQADNYQHLTGSYVPQNVQRNGPVTNGSSDVRVVDQSDINNSGGKDVPQTLRQLGVTH